MAGARERQGHYLRRVPLMPAAICGGGSPKQRKLGRDVWTKVASEHQSPSEVGGGKGQPCP